MNFIKNFRIKMKFKNILLLVSLILTMFILLILSIQTFSSSQKYISEKANKINQSNLLQTGIKLENNLYIRKNLTDYISTDEKLLNDLYIIKDTEPGQKSKITQDIRKYLEFKKQQDDYISDIIILTDTFTFSTQGNNDLYRMTLNEVMNSQINSFIENTASSAAVFVVPKKMNEIDSVSEDLTIFDKSYGFLTGLYKDNTFLGVLFILLDFELFDNTLDQKNQFVLMYSSDSIAWASPSLREEDFSSYGIYDIFNKGEINYKLKSTNLHLYHMKLFEKNLSLILISVNQQFFEHMNLEFLIIIAFLLSLFFVFLFSKLIISKITIPIQRLTSSIQHYNVGKAPLFLHKFRKPNMTLREAILYYLIGVIIIPIILFMAMTYIMSIQLINYYGISGYNQSFSQTADNINDCLLLKEKVLRNIIYNDIIQNALSKKLEVSDAEIINIVDRSIRLSPWKDSITIYDKNKTLFFSNDIPIHDNEHSINNIIALLNKQDQVILWHSSSRDPYNRIQLNVFMKINSLTEIKTIGYLHCKIDEREIESIYEKGSYEGSNIFIIDLNNLIISHKDKNAIGTVYYDIDTSLLSRQNISTSGFQLSSKLKNDSWVLVGQYPHALLQKDKNALINEKIYILITIGFSIILISFVFSYSLTKPMNKFRDLLSLMSIDNIDILFPEENLIQEINELGKAFNEMIIRNESLIDKLVLSTTIQEQLKSEKKDAELIALQAQINPHFLYNTFDSINWVIKCNNKECAIEMIKNLSELLKYIAKSSEPIISIAEEIEYIRCYTEIMKIRYDNELDIIWELSDGVLDNQMIRLTLQPIVENAIYHGIKPKQNAGIIKIYSYCDNNLIILGVQDNGIGILPNSLKALQQSLNQDNSHKKIGLHNVQRRIRLFFGSCYGLHISSIPGKQTVVEMRIPKKPKVKQIKSYRKTI